MKFKTIILLPIYFILSGCSVKPLENAPVVAHFDVFQYLGTWHEIARLDHSFERGLEQASAEYSLRKDGGLKVVNRGFNTKTQKWKIAEGKAYFTGQPDVGALKVSFFGPFYGGYNILALDKTYENALIAGPNRQYLWLLSRHKVMKDDIKMTYLKQAKEYGFDTEALIWVKQN